MIVTSYSAGRDDHGIFLQPTMHFAKSLQWFTLQLLQQSQWGNPHALLGSQL